MFKSIIAKYKTKKEERPIESLNRYLKEDRDRIYEYIKLKNNYKCDYYIDDEELNVSITDENKTDVFKAEVELFASYECGDDRMYISGMQRMPYGVQNGTASIVLDGIADIAEHFGFSIVAVHPAACENEVKGALDQDSLEDWYEKHLGNRGFVYKTVRDVDEMKQMDAPSGAKLFKH